MKQVAQNYKSGEIALLDVPRPACRARARIYISQPSGPRNSTMTIQPTRGPSGQPEPGGGSQEGVGVGVSQAIDRVGSGAEERFGGMLPRELMIVVSAATGVLLCCIGAPPSLSCNALQVTHRLRQDSAL